MSFKPPSPELQRPSYVPEQPVQVVQQPQPQTTVQPQTQTPVQVVQQAQPTEQCPCPETACVCISIGLGSDGATTGNSLGNNNNNNNVVNNDFQQTTTTSSVDIEEKTFHSIEEIMKFFKQCSFQESKYNPKTFLRDVFSKG